MLDTALGALQGSIPLKFTVTPWGMYYCLHITDEAQRSLFVVSYALNLSKCAPDILLTSMFRCFIHFNSLNPEDNQETDSIITPTLEMRNLGIKKLTNLPVVTEMTGGHQCRARIPERFSETGDGF